MERKNEFDYKYLLPVINKTQDFNLNQQQPYQSFKLISKDLSLPTSIVSSTLPLKSNNIDNNNNTNDSFETPKADIKNDIHRHFQSHRANLPTLQDNDPYYSAEYSKESNFMRHKPQPIKIPTLFPLQNPLLSYNLMSKTSQNKNEINNSPDSGLKEMSFDSNVSDMFNNIPINTSMDYSQLNNVDSTCASHNEDYKSHLNTNLNYLFNIKSKLNLNSFKNVSNTEMKFDKNQPQKLNDLNKVNNCVSSSNSSFLNKENFSIKIAKKKFNPFQIHDYSSITTPSSSALLSIPVATNTASIAPIASSTIKKSQPVYFSPTFKKNKSMSNSSIDNYSLSEGYDSLKQNDEDIVKLNLSKSDKYYRSTSVGNSDENICKNQQNSSEDEEENSKLIKFRS